MRLRWLLSLGKASMKETIEDIRKSGIAHLLAISAHMAMIMFAIFAIIRFIMALFMNFALKYNIKKIATYFAIAFGFSILLFQECLFRRYELILWSLYFS